MTKTISLALAFLVACAPPTGPSAARPRAPSLGAAEPDTSPHILIGAGDISGCAVANKDELTARLVDSVLSDNPTAWAFAAGDDAYYHGSAADWACYDASWGAFKARTIFALGNHEYNQDTTARASFDYILGEGVDSGFNGVRGKGWHAHDVGAWRVYVLNSENVSVTDQTAWLKADLAANPRLCQLMMFHKPYHTPAIDIGGGELVPAQKTKPWHLAFRAAHGDVVVNGHEHFYRSTYNIRPDTTPGAPNGATVADTGGYRVFIEGGGGQEELTPAPAVQPYDRKVIVTYGVLKLTLRAADYKWEKLDTTGAVLDKGSRGCH